MMKRGRTCRLTDKQIDKEIKASKFQDDYGEGTFFKCRICQRDRPYKMVSTKPRMCCLCAGEAKMRYQ